MKLFPLLALICLSFFNADAQRISGADRLALEKKQDTLNALSMKIIQGINPADRFNADSLFTKTFVRALKTPHSFYFPFDSLYTISKLYSPDSSFRIYTWQMVINDNVIRQHGAIQMRTPDGSLKLFPLIDKSDITQNLSDTISNHFGWMGAVYYRIIETKAQGKPGPALFLFHRSGTSNRRFDLPLPVPGEEKR